MLFEGKVYILLKEEVLDPQGQVVRNALKTLNFTGVEEVRVGKYIRLQLKAPDRSRAEKQVNEMCRKLLANPVIENYSFELLPVSEKARSRFSASSTHRVNRRHPKKEI